MDHFTKAYLKIILEEVLTDSITIDQINRLPSPFNEYFNNMREAMLKAVYAETDEEMTSVNKEVNKWRDTLINFWLKNSSKFAELEGRINSILMKMISRYTALMKGCNTGYADVG